MCLLLLPTDPVARFHLRNGASFHRLNWMANLSKKGITLPSSPLLSLCICLKRFNTFEFNNYQIFVKNLFQVLSYHASIFSFLSVTLSSMSLSKLGLFCSVISISTFTSYHKIACNNMRGVFFLLPFSRSSCLSCVVP